MSDIGPLPPPQNHDAEWAWRLWNSLQIASPDGTIAGGVWDMPGVGRYRRTGPMHLTLTEIHSSMEPDRLGVTVWNKHDWVCLLAEAIGWEIISDQVQKADTAEPHDPEEPELEHIGKAFACPCGLVYSLHGADSGFTRFSVGSEGHCLNTTCDIVLPYPHAGRLNVVDDSALLAKMEAQEQISIAVDEDEYPAPPDDPIIINDPPYSEEEVEWEGMTEEEKIAHLELYRDGIEASKPPSEEEE